MSDLRASGTVRHDTAHGEPSTRHWLRFLRHFTIMIVAMYVGMLTLTPVYAWISGRLGYPQPEIQLPVLSAIVMAVTMTAPMIGWMRYHRHGWRSVLEMAAAMVIPAVLAAALHLVGAVSAETVMSIGHLGMIPAMLAVMLYRYRQYAA